MSADPKKVGARPQLIQRFIMEMLRISYGDYCGARACFLLGLIEPGYVLAVQASEKMLKALLLSVCPRYGKAKVKNFEHKLSALLKETIRIIKKE